MSSTSIHYPLPEISIPLLPNYAPLAASYITNNRVPLECEEPELQSKVAELQNALTSIGRDVYALENCLSQLHLRQREIEEVAQGHRNLFSAVRRIPPEIIAEIMTHSTHTLNDSSSALDTNSGPWLLGNVSHRWREAALSFPTVWSHIIVREYTNRGTRFPYSTETSFPSHAVQILQTWVHRSQRANLTIAFQSSSSPVGLELLSILMAESVRWENVNLNVDGRILLSLGVIRGKLPRLRNLNVALMKRVNPAKTYPFNAFEIVPSLRTLCLGSNIDSVTLQILIFPWNQITNFRCGSLLGDDIDVLRRLTHVEVYCGQVSTQSLSPGDLVHLPNLRILDIRHSSCGPWLNHVVLPSLDDITCSPGDCDFSTLESVIARSHASPTKLCVSSIFATEPHLTIPEFLTLRTLELKFHIFSKEYIAPIVHFPVLEHLSLTIEFDILHVNQVLDVAEARAIRRLTLEVRGRGRNTSVVAITDRIAGLRASGMIVDYHRMIT